MNPLQLEQIMMMMSSFTSGSIFRRTGCLPREYPYTPRPIHPKKASSTEKNKSTPLRSILIATFSERYRCDFDGR